jgi:uncharacterized protein YecE (DUF72 family)
MHQSARGRVSSEAGRLLIGTSGYVYRHWREVLYPRGLPPARWLPRYAEVFDTVELNNTFYRLPPLGAARRWRDETPPGFVFAAKGSRFLTHMKRLTDTGAGVRRFFARVRSLKEKLAVVLWQLPPQMKRVDLERLDAFLAALPLRVRHACEFRDAAWYTGEVCDVLDAHAVAFCEHDIVTRQPPRATGGFRYLRFHGRAARYAGRYGREALAGPARQLAEWRDQGRDAFVYFNNDWQGHAVLDALELRALLERR